MLCTQHLLHAIAEQTPLVSSIEQALIRFILQTALSMFRKANIIVEKCVLSIVTNLMQHSLTPNHFSTCSHSPFPKEEWTMGISQKVAGSSG